MNGIRAVSRAFLARPRHDLGRTAASSASQPWSFMARRMAARTEAADGMGMPRKDGIAGDVVQAPGGHYRPAGSAAASRQCGSPRDQRAEPVTIIDGLSVSGRNGAGGIRSLAVRCAPMPWRQEGCQQEMPERCQRSGTIRRGLISAPISKRAGRHLPRRRPWRRAHTGPGGASGTGGAAHRRRHRRPVPDHQDRQAGCAIGSFTSRRRPADSADRDEGCLGQRRQLHAMERGQPGRGVLRPPSRPGRC
jgi:hypothetical protein